MTLKKEGELKGKGEVLAVMNDALRGEKGINMGTVKQRRKGARTSQLENTGPASKRGPTSK